MSAVPRPQSGQFFPGAGWWWMLPVLAALVFVIWVDRLRIERVQYVAQTASWSVETPAEDPSSPTGYAGKTRRLIVPGHHHPSYRWIMQAQDLLAGGGWRQHHVAHENFPHGYESRDTSPYRWWLALVAWTDHGLTGRSFPLAVERAALYADPLLHLLLVLSVTLFAGRQFGRSAAVLAALALAALFPLAGAFQPGAPDHHALAWACALWATLPLLAGSLRTNAPRWFALAGVAGGLAYWTDPFVGETFLAGLAAGAAAAIWFMRAPVRAGSSPPLPWRAWGFAGGLTCLAAWLVEYFPSYSWELAGSVNPLPAISWLGLGELLHRLSHWAHGQRAAWNRPAVVSTALAVLAMVALPATKLLAENGRFLAPDLFAAELVNLPGGVRASGLGGWLARDGLSGRLVATLAPLVLAGLGIRLLLSAKTAPLQRGVLALALGPCLVTLVLACFQLRWWSGCQLALTGLLVTLAALPATRHWGWGVGCALVLLPGLAFLVPPAGSRGSAPLDELELQAVVERDLAWWFVRQQGATPTVVFTTPATTKALAYFADIKGVASYAPENTAGIAAATRIASASTWTEAAVLLEGRNITHLLLPSWDSSLEHLARMGRQLPSGAELPRNTLIALLRDWNLPPWLRLLTYHVPPDLGRGNFTATVFALSAEQDEILAVCRLADYLVETDRLGDARAVRETLRSYPRSLPALAALAHVNRALGDTAASESALQSLLPYLSRRSGRTLPVDRRISLAALLVQAGQRDAARDQMELCAAELTATNLRELTTGERVRLLALNDLLGVSLSDPALRPLALSLLPPSLADRLRKPGE